MHRLSLLLVAFALITTGFTGPVTADEVEDPYGTVCVNPTGDAECEIIAASGTGNATAERWHGPAVAAASGTGNASASAKDGVFEVPPVAVAVSGTGDATAATFSNPPPVGSYGAAAIAASGTGDGVALGEGEGYFVLLAVSGAGDTLATRGLLSGAISGTGNATGGDSAVSGAGDTNSHHVAASVVGDADGCVAASGTGHTTSSGCSWFVTSIEGVEASGCETVYDNTGSEAACQDADPEALLP